MKLYYMLMLLVGLSTQLEAQEIQIVEYFFDQDPGYGNGTALTIKNDQEMELNLDIPVNSLTVGFHQLYVRAMDKNGHWSHTNKVNFYRLKSKLTGATPIHKLEYFIDTDPGFGNGNALSFDSEAEDLIQNYLIDLSTTDPGFHILRVRAMDQFGNWSMTLEQGFYVVPEKKEITNIIALKYYYVTKDSISQTYVHNLATPTSLLDIQFSVNTDFLKQDQDYTMYVWALGSNGSSSLIETIQFKYGNKKNNTPPEVIGSLSDLTLPVGFGSKNIEIGSVFSDPDGDVLVYSAVSNEESIVSIELNGSELKLIEKGEGNAEITVYAEDGNGGIAEVKFMVTVSSKPNEAPVLVNAISDQTAIIETPFSFEIPENTFSDPDGDTLSFSASLEGKPLPSWLNFNDGRRILSGTPSENGTLQIEILVYDNNGGSVSTKFQIIVEEKPNSIENDLLKQSLTVFPNPGDGLFHLELNHKYKGKVLVSISGIDGKEYFFETLNKNRKRLTQNIDLKGIAAGLYVLKIETDDASSILRLVVSP